MGAIEKQCSGCKKMNCLESFPRNKNGLYGRKSKCKACAKKYYDTNRETILKQKKDYEARNKNKIAAYRRQYYLRNKEHFVHQAVLREKHYMQTSPQFKIAKNLRDRIRKSLKRNKGIKAGSAIKDLGCSIEELRTHLEGQFKDGMSWENYGSKWHIDHIVPLYSFDLTLRNDFLKACHYTNLRPLSAQENLKRPKK